MFPCGISFKSEETCGREEGRKGKTKKVKKGVDKG
jgi:hypothetical protein